MPSPNNRRGLLNFRSLYLATAFKPECGVDDEANPKRKLVDPLSMMSGVARSRWSSYESGDVMAAGAGVGRRVRFMACRTTATTNWSPDWDDLLTKNVSIWLATKLYFTIYE